MLVSCAALLWAGVASAQSLVPGPGEPGHDAALAALADAYDRQIHGIMTVELGWGLEAFVSDPADRALMDELLLLPGPLSVIVPPEANDAETMILDIRDAGFEALLGADGPNAPSVAAQAAGAATPLGAHATQIYAMMDLAGRADRDFSGVIEFLNGVR